MGVLRVVAPQSVNPPEISASEPHFIANCDEEGKKFVKGICVIEEPLPSCKSGPMPDGEG